MAYIMDMLRRVFRKQPKPTNLQRVSWLLHPYVDKLHGVLLWNNPMISAWCLIAVNLMFWFVRTIQIRPLGIIGGALMLAVGLDGVCLALGACKRSCNERDDFQNGNAGRIAVAYREIKQQFIKFSSTCRQCREQKPLKYCVTAVCGFAILIVLMDILGALFTHGLLTLVFLSPLTPNLVNKMNTIQSSPDSDHEVEEFMPELTNKVMEELNRAGEIQESIESCITTGDLSLPPGENAALRYAAGEAESSDEDDVYTETKAGDKETTSLLTDSSDSDSEFNIKVGDHPMMDDFYIKQERIVDAADMSWFSSHTPDTYRTHMIQSDTDDDFEIIDRSEVNSTDK